jgi:hypothetical protein
MRKLSVLSVGAFLAVSLVLVGTAGIAGAHAKKAPVVTVTSVSPQNGSVNGGTTVTIKGKNLVGATSVSFGSSTVNATVKSSHAITAVSPPGTGTVELTVTTSNDGSSTPTATASDEFNYVSEPVVQSVSPRSGTISGGTKVTISGSDFIGVTTVDFGSSAGTGLDVISAQALTVVTPAESAGKVAVTLSGGGATSPPDSAAQYTFVLHLPKVTNVNPNTDPAGTQVTITGTGFTQGTLVYFGGVEASGVTVLSSKSITATAPSGTGTVDVTVTTTKASSNPNPPYDDFTYTTSSS